MATKEQYVGNWFEGVIQDALKEIQATHPATWHRFTDSKAARSIVQAQPGDFLFIYGGVPILIEAKCSIKYDNLRSGFSSLWPKRQAAMHRKWHRAEAPSWIIFCDYDETNKYEHDNCAEIWQGVPLASARSIGQKIPINVEPMTCRVSGLEKALLHCAERELEDIF